MPLKFIYEAHWVLDNFFYRLVIRHSDKVVVITKGIKEDIMPLGIESKKILVWPDAVDIKRFTSPVEDMIDLRKELGLAKSIKIVLYSGSLKTYYSWKGVDTLLEAAQFFPQNVACVLIGGKKEEIEKLKLEYQSQNIYFISYVPHRLIPQYLKEADILVLPNKKGNIISEKYTSPMKLFEYMASGVPIVASDLPSIKEILSEETAFFFQPNDQADLAQTVRRALEDVGAPNRAQRAKEEVLRYSWEIRAKEITEFIS